MPSGGGGDAHASLLSAIQQGTKLKKPAAELPAAPQQVRDGLLAQIAAGGFALKKVSDAPPKKPEVPLPGGGGNDLASTLKNAMATRRVAQESDSDSDSDWDDD